MPVDHFVQNINEKKGRETGYERQRVIDVELTNDRTEGTMTLTLEVTGEPNNRSWQSTGDI